MNLKTALSRVPSIENFIYFVFRGSRSSNKIVRINPIAKLNWPNISEDTYSNWNQSVFGREINFTKDFRFLTSSHKALKMLVKNPVEVSSPESNTNQQQLATSPTHMESSDRSGLSSTIHNLASNSPNNDSSTNHVKHDLNTHLSPHNQNETNQMCSTQASDPDRVNISVDLNKKNDDNNMNEEDGNEEESSVTIIHFNDCYNIEAGPQSSGAAGFLTAINQYRHLNPIILFSGDIISPSFMSTFTKGEQMIPVLNDIKVDCAVFGNHEFDYGVDNLIDFVKKTTFPWLLSNVIDKETSNQLGDGEIFHIIERSGVKFGLIGLIEEEWLSILSTLDSSDVIYQDFVERGQQLAKWLKSEPHNVDYVIALTHFRRHNDIRLADSVPEIDLILSGHDHDYMVIKRSNSFIIKSGTDFREFSKIKLKIDSNYLNAKRNNSHLNTFLDLDIERVECLNYEPDLELKNKLNRFITTIDEKMGKVLGQFNCELDGRFSSIRKFETNLGNFVTDIMLASTHADLAILNSGTLRSDRIHPKGDFTMRDLFNILGYIDPIAVLQATGYQIWKALENGVSQWPKLEGRFPQVSGCTFLFDPSKPAMERIDPKNILIGDEQLILDKEYKLTTKAYLASGKDGYAILKQCQVLVPSDESPDLTTSILNHFESINIVKSNRRTHHRQSIICLSRTSLKKILDQTSSSSNLNLSIDGSNHITHSQSVVATCLPSPGNQVQSNLRSGGQSMAIAACSCEIEEEGDDINNDNNNNNDDDGGDDDDVKENMIVARKCDYPAGVEISSQSKLNNGRHAILPSASSSLVGTVTAQSSLQTHMVGHQKESMDTTILSTESPSNVESHCKPRTKRMMSLYEMENEQCKLEPKVEGRIRIVGVNN